MSATIQNPYAAWLIIGCTVMVLLVVFGSTTCHILSVLNRKCHLLGWESGSIYTWEDDDE
ncbi:MAG: hypothetical protein NC344_08015 [Bacteroidales bacterium]|nr:hypothetical protein [Bacteroidales bacterium]MCM1147760.1 hypothetical protein [Bacteroidales bacterium]MCM1206630.1 hypothetical protein [Bacillota bacterium]MCM1510629.1 hypothetical protein [Clostridium sp.]